MPCFRTDAHDGLEGEEGTFFLRTFWLEAFALADRVDQIRQVFDTAAFCANRVCVLDPVMPDESAWFLA